MQSRIGAIVYATADPRLGALDTFFYSRKLNGHTDIFRDQVRTMRDECARFYALF